MKVGVVGCGFVGSTAAYALVMDGIGREIVLVDMQKERAIAEAADISHAIPFAHPMKVVTGDYADLAGCKVVIVAAGVSQKPGETRLQLLERNAAVFRAVVPSILQHAPDTILLIATNPVDIMTHIASHYAREFDVPATRVIGTGTTLDSARFRLLLGNHFGVDARHVHAYVIGEHGDSEVLTWSLARIGGMSLDDFARMGRIDLSEETRKRIDAGVRRAAYAIIEGKGATYYGIGAALARIVSTLIHDQRGILTVSSNVDNLHGVTGVTASLPRILGGNGVLQTLSMNLSDTEADAFRRSTEIIREFADSIAGSL